MTKRIIGIDLAVSAAHKAIVFDPAYAHWREQDVAIWPIMISFSRMARCPVFKEDGRVDTAEWLAHDRISCLSREKLVRMAFLQDIRSPPTGLQSSIYRSPK
jgi:hypothetical protein